MFFAAEVLPKYFYRFASQTSPFPKSRVSLIGKTHSGALLANGDTKRVGEAQDTETALSLPAPRRSFTLEEMPSGNNLIDQGKTTVDIKKSLQTNSENIVFEVGGLMLKLRDIDRNTSSQLNRMAELVSQQK